jgi:hypothetical protein
MASRIEALKSPVNISLESPMTRVSLDTHDEAVKQFVLGLTVDPDGSGLELNGQPVACVVPPPKAMNRGEAEWTDAKKARPRKKKAV